MPSPDYSLRDLPSDQTVESANRVSADMDTGFDIMLSRLDDPVDHLCEWDFWKNCQGELDNFPLFSPPPLPTNLASFVEPADDDSEEGSKSKKEFQICKTLCKQEDTESDECLIGSDHPSSVRCNAPDSKVDSPTSDKTHPLNNGNDEFRGFDMPLDPELEPTPIGPQGVGSVTPDKQMSSPVAPRKAKITKKKISYKGVITVDDFKRLSEMKEHDFDMLFDDENENEESKPKPSTISLPSSSRRIPRREWESYMEDLIAFKNEYGHCNVPVNQSEHRELGMWVKRQRYHIKLYHEGRRASTTAERVNMLQSIGFILDSHATRWDAMYEKMVEYKNENGNCDVPFNCPHERVLAVWVKRQRRKYVTNAMPAHRIERLNRIGFSWRLCARRISATPSQSTAAKKARKV